MVSDNELVARVAATGDHAAFQQLVTRHQAPLRNFLRRLTAGDDATADDAAQEAFLAAFQKIHTFKGTAKFSTWLHTIAYRQFISMKRKTSRMQVMDELPDAGVDERQDTDNEILAKQLMGQLIPEDRACLTLHYSVGMSHADIAEVIDQPLGSVKSRIHRAKQKLQRWLEKHDHSLQDKTPGTSGEETRNAG